MVDDSVSIAQLKELVADLESRVHRSLAVKQEMIGMRDRLDGELGRYRMIQEYSQARPSRLRAVK